MFQPTSPMVHKWQTTVLSAATLGSSAKLVGLAVSNHATPRGIATPSFRELARVLHLSERTIQTGIRQLVQCGLIERERYGSAGSLYRLRMPS